MTDSGYEALAQAIIVQASRDYADALKKLKRNPRHKSSLETKAEVEDFFRSEWYESLTTVDGEMIIRKLKENAGYDG